MLYELHLTTENTVDVDSWVDFCRDLNIKPLEIELEGDEAYPDQVMMAAVHNGDDESAWDWAAGIAGEMVNNGFPVIREKMEVPLDKSAPYTDPVYHETHIKSLIPGHHVQDIVKFSRAFGWVASRNGLYRNEAGLEKWYFTMRDYHNDYLTAGGNFRQLFAALPEFCWHTVRMEMETVIADSNEELDAGWAI